MTMFSFFYSKSGFVPGELTVAFVVGVAHGRWVKKRAHLDSKE
jgi:hypothetical protein